MPPVALWSPDSKRLITHKLDQREVLPLHLLQRENPQLVSQVVSAMPDRGQAIWIRKVSGP